MFFTTTRETSRAQETDTQEETEFRDQLVQSVIYVLMYYVVMYYVLLYYVVMYYDLMWKYLNM
jgi:hypothetical protein